MVATLTSANPARYWFVDRRGSSDSSPDSIPNPPVPASSTSPITPPPAIAPLVTAPPVMTPLVTVPAVIISLVPVPVVTLSPVMMALVTVPVVMPIDAPSPPPSGTLLVDLEPPCATIITTNTRTNSFSARGLSASFRKRSARLWLAISDSARRTQPYRKNRKKMPEIITEDSILMKRTFLI